MKHELVSTALLRRDIALILRRVEGGAVFVVTRNGAAVARIVAAGRADDRLEAAGLRPPRRPGSVPRVRPARLRTSLTRAVLEERD